MRYIISLININLCTSISYELSYLTSPKIEEHKLILTYSQTLTEKKKKWDAFFLLVKLNL